MVEIRDASQPMTSMMPPPAIARGELYLGAMSIMAAADGRISETETRTIRALAASIPEIENAELTTLIPNAAMAIRSAHEQPEWVRRKAFVLGLEVVTRGNEAGYQEEGDPNLRGVTTLQRCLHLPDDFMTAALTTVRAKYVGGDADEATLTTLVDAMLYVATATRTSISRLRRVANILETVPQLSGREITSLFHISHLIAGRPFPMLEPAGPDALAERLRKIPRFRDKTVALACEVATALGLDPTTERALVLVEQAVATTRGLPEAARQTWAARYATAP